MAGELELGFQIGKSVTDAIQRGAADWKAIQLERAERKEFEQIQVMVGQRQRLAREANASPNRETFRQMYKLATRYPDAQVIERPTGNVGEDGTPQTEGIIRTPEGDIPLEQLWMLGQGELQAQLDEIKSDMDLAMEVQARYPTNRYVKQWVASVGLGIKQKTDLLSRSREAQQLQLDRIKAQNEADKLQLEREKFQAEPERFKQQQAAQQERELAVQDDKQAGDIALERERGAQARLTEGAKAKTPKPPTEVQSKAATFGRRVEQAIGELESIDYDRTALRAGAEAMLPNVAKPEGLQRIEQAERNFLTAVLRKESGALITESEYKSGEKQYFPRAGDSKSVVEQKARNRQLAFEALKGEAGAAWESVPEGETALTRGNPPGTTKGGDMVRVRAPDGRVGVIPRSKLGAALQAGAQQVE